ncbi:uncharacterized protein J8A68_000945 [[Candida] subhashii]|uniref:glutathione-specific gamma-glutamylcyclotransferase n=1 Tax=[Candida] subhashii TaxID=561895 RepID=A0A8J5QSC2_9ASCO|nr:uncharacterized protein J8A68_000945 [[Candida] subhashii]KAG7665543.1 hypothetical protein J8A68_000945 [[Candida] subhashii]
MSSPVPQQGMWIIGYGSLIFKPPPHVSFKLTGYLKGFIRRFWQSSNDHRGTPKSPGRVVTLVSLSDLKRYDKFHSDLHMYELSKTHQETDLSQEGETTSSEILDITHHISQLTEEDLKVWGVAYYIAPENVQYVKEYLDIREQNGYSTHLVPFHILNIESVESSPSTSIMNELSQDEKTGDYYIESMIYIGTIDNEAFVGPESIEDTAKVIKTSQGPSGTNVEYLQLLTNAVRGLDPRIHDYYLEDLCKLIDIPSLT